MTPPQLPRLLAPALAAALAGPAAWAQSEERPITAGVVASVLQDSNVNLSPDGAEVSDTVYSLGARANLNARLGRQTLLVRGSLDTIRYQELSDNNNEAYNLLAVLDWSTVDRLSGQLGAQVGQSFNRFRRTSAGTNIERVRRGYARAQLGGVTMWTFESNAEVYQRYYTVDGAGVRNLERASLDIAARYRTTPAWSARVGARHTKGEYPNFLPSAADEFTRTDLETGISWTPNPITSVQARLALSQESHTLQAGADGGFFSGSVTANWQPTGKLNVVATLSRDRDTTTGIESDDPLASTVDATTRTRLGLELGWALSTRTQLALQADTVRSDQDGLNIDGSATQRSLGVVMRYSPDRAVDISCRARWSTQSVNGTLSGIGEYSARQAGCEAAVWLR